MSGVILLTSLVGVLFFSTASAQSKSSLKTIPVEMFLSVRCCGGGDALFRGWEASFVPMIIMEDCLSHFEFY